MVKCPRKYKNQGNERFGEQKYVTSDMLWQFCKNDAWLYGQIMDLWGEANPVSRKRFSPIPLDENNSFSTVTTTEGRIGFDESTSKNVYVDLNKTEDVETWIDYEKTNVMISSQVQERQNDEGEWIGHVVNEAHIPPVLTTTIDTESTRNYSPWVIRDKNGNILNDNMTVNEYWYIGFDRNRHYETRPNWLKERLNGEIPGVSRAQTFKANNTGYLENLILKLKGSNNTGMQLIIQIRRCESINGVMTPVSTAYPPLAHAEVRFENTNPGVFSVHFDNPAYLEEGKTYAFVLLSGLSHPSNCYWIGGWTYNLKGDIYKDGDAFYSQNNGHDFIRYGKDDTTKEYDQGKEAPRDFAFQCHIREEAEETYDQDKDYYLYLKPILSNPVKSVTISKMDDGDNTDRQMLTYEVSNDGYTWHSINTRTYTFEGEPKHVTFVRVRFQPSADGTKTPYLRAMNILLQTELPKEAYGRTEFYNPATCGILSANVWGRVNAPSTIEFSGAGETSCKIDIIQSKEVTEHFTIIRPHNVINYLSSLISVFGEEKYDAIIKDLSQSKYQKEEWRIYDYLKANDYILEELKKQRIFVNSCPDKDGNTDVPALFNLENNKDNQSIKLINSPAYPTYNCMLQRAAKPEEGEKEELFYGEWYDYEFNYDNDELTFSHEVLKEMPEGTISISYNPVFVQDIDAQTEMPFRLDYRQESFTVDEEIIENKYIELLMPPRDPLRSVVVSNTEIDEYDLEEYDNQLFLYEDEDFKVDYDNNRIMFFQQEDGTIPLNLKDIITVTYTPDLDDTGISIGYRLKREDTLSKIFAEPNYIEYKT